MATKLIFLTLISLLLLLILENVRALEFEENSFEKSTNATHCDCGNHLRKLVNNIYKGNFENFQKVINFANISDDADLKADVLFGLYDAMSKANHTESLFKALDLYLIIEITFYENLSSENFKQLLKIQDGILNATIVPKAANLIASNIYMNGFQRENAAFKKLLDKLKADFIVLEYTIKYLIKNVNWLPAIELIQLLGNLTADVELNLKILLILGPNYALQEHEQYIYFVHLMKLYNTVRASTEHAIFYRADIDDIIPRPLKSLLSEKVCFYQKRAGGSTYYYMHKCEASNHICLYLYQSSQAAVVAFDVDVKRQPYVFNIRGARNNEVMHRLASSNADANDELQFDVFSSLVSAEIDEFAWKIVIEHEQVVVQNVEGTKYLCAFKDLMIGNMVFTRGKASFELNAEECKWYVNECH